MLMDYVGSLGIYVSAEIAELRKQLEVFKLKANGKCGSTRASDWMVQTGVVLLFRKTFHISSSVLIVTNEIHQTIRAYYEMATQSVSEWCTLLKYIT